ncbi:MAG: hypothetical protein WDN49_08830 [Acetobacteraceae bacterium]
MVHRWQKQRADWPEGWPEGSLALSAQLTKAGQDIIHVADAERLPPGSIRSALAEAGVRSWVSVQRRKAGRVTALLGLEWADAPRAPGRSSNRDCC